MLSVLKIKQPVFKVLSLLFCYSYAEILKSLQFDIRTGQAANIFEEKVIPVLK